MEWVVQIIGNKFVLGELSKSLKSSELCVFQKGQAFFLKCSNFNRAIDAKDVFEQAKRILPILSGATRLELGQPLELGKVFRVNDDGTLQEFGFCWGEFTLPKLFMRGSGTGAQVSNIADNVNVWLKTAQKDAKATEALSLFGSIELNWVILYKTFEIIEVDIQTKVYKKGWANKTAEERFTRTAQPHRHAKHSKKIQEWRPHDNPMRFEEAVAFIRTILDAWLRSKGKEGTFKYESSIC